MFFEWKSLSSSTNHHHHHQIWNWLWRLPNFSLPGIVQQRWSRRATVSEPCCNIFLMEVGSQSVAVILTDVCWLSRLAFDDPSVGTSPLNSTFFLFFLTEQCNNISGLKLIEQNQHISKLQSFFSSKLEISFIRIEKSPLSQWRKHLQQG